MSQIEFYTLCPVRAGGPNYIKLDPARLHATILTSVILTSPPPLSALKLRQGWGCECTFLLASPECARPHASPIVPLGRVVVCSAANHTAQSSRIAIRLWMQPLPLRGSFSFSASPNEACRSNNGRLSVGMASLRTQRTRSFPN